MNTIKILFFLVWVIREVNLEPEQNEIAFSEYLGGFNGNNGLESISPLGIIKEIYVSRNPGLLTFLHMSFSELFHNTQIWASFNNSVYMVKPRSDALSLEATTALKHASTNGEREILQTLVNTKDEILNRVFSASEFSHLQSPQRVNKNSPKEDLVKLIDKDKIISSFRVQTLHNILTEAIAMLRLSQSNPFKRFTSDQIIWEASWWKFLTIAYGPRREYLSRDKQMFNTLRFVIFTLVEARLHRVESKDYRDSLDRKLTSFANELKKLFDHQNLISTAQTHILEELSNLKPIPTNSGLAEDDCPPCQSVETSESAEVLESKLTSLDNNIQGILSRINTMDNPYTKIFSETDEITMGLNKIKADLQKFSGKFTFFKQINSQIEILTDKFEQYKVIYIIYTTMAAVLILVLIKLLSFSLYLISCCKDCCQFNRDLQKFLKQRKEDRNQGRNQDRHQEAPYPLVNYPLR